MYVQYFIVGIMGLTSVMKLLAPGGIAKEFWFVPGWSWPLLGAYQLLTVYLMHVQNDYAAAAPLIYVFLGGAIYSMAKAGKLVAAPFPLFTAVCAWSATLVRNNTDTASHIAPYMGLGFVAALVLCTLFGASARPAKKAKSA